MAPIFTHAAANEIPVEIDQEVYERVFLECVKSFKGPDVTNFNDLDEAIRQCGSQAGHIAIRKGEYYIDQGADWLKAKPYVKEAK